MITIQTSVSKGWLHANGGFRFDESYYFDPLHRWQQDRAVEQFLLARLPGYPFFNMESNLVQHAHFSPNQVLVGALQPNLIVGACLGAELVFSAERDADIAGRPLEDLASTADLPEPTSLLEHPLIRRWDAQVESLRQTRPDLRVIPPFFWDTSGRATIHGFITTALKLCGESIFLRVYDEPEFVTAIHDWITSVYLALIRHYSRLGALPVTSVHIGECSGTMLRPDHYGQFVIPFASRLGRELGAVRLHSCGRSDHLLPAIAAIENLQVLDSGSHTSVAAIRARFGREFRLNLAPPAELLLASAPRAGVEAWLDRTLAENAGGPLQIAFHLEPGYSQENCLALHEALRRR
jgi:hypothetical protein